MLFIIKKLFYYYLKVNLFKEIEKNMKLVLKDITGTNDSYTTLTKSFVVR